MTSSNGLHFLVTAERAEKKRAEDAKTIRTTVVEIENFSIELSVKSLPTAGRSENSEALMTCSERLQGVLLHVR